MNAAPCPVRWGWWVLGCLGVGACLAATALGAHRQSPHYSLDFSQQGFGAVTAGSAHYAVEDMIEFSIPEKIEHKGGNYVVSSPLLAIELHRQTKAAVRDFDVYRDPRPPSPRP